MRRFAFVVLALGAAGTFAFAAPVAAAGCASMTASSKSSTTVADTSDSTPAKVPGKAQNEG